MSADGPADFENVVELSITSDPKHASHVRNVTAEAAAAAGLGEKDASELVLAVDEAISNVIKHGYEGCPGQPIEVRLERVQRDNAIGIQVTICDSGRCVDPEYIAGRDLDDVRPGGLGTHIIRSVMDEVEYTPRQPNGMQLRMVKMKTAPQDEP